MSEIKNNRPIDFDVRQRALDTGQSFAVAAPAGSGKTGLLTLRLLKLLCLCEHPENVLCITFTRKAAAEMRERLLQTLAQAQEPLPENAGEHARMTRELALQVLDRDAKLNWQLQTMPARLRIQTIDSFCRSLASQLPIASALGADLGTLDNPDQAYRLAVGQLLDNYARGNPDNTQHQDLEILIRHLDNQLNRLENLLVNLLANRDQWMGLLYRLKYEQREPLEQALRNWGRELVEKVSADLAPFAGEIFDAVRYAAANLRDENPEHGLLTVEEDLAQLPGNSDKDIERYWQPLINLLLTNDGGWRKRLDKGLGFPAGATKDEKVIAKAHKEKFSGILNELKALPCLLDNLQELRQFPGSTYTSAQWALLSSLTGVLPHLVAELKLVFRQLGATDFVEVTEAALAALGSADEPSDLALKLDYQIYHILVDEFQDTATPQLSLLEKITEGWQPDDGRTLFVVGDGMQSCYGFRDANVGIFLDVRHQGLPSVAVEPLDLRVNFRSRAGVVDWVNQVFKGAFPAADDIGRGAVRYSLSDAFDPGTIEHCVTCAGFVDQDDHRVEARYIAGEIAKLRTRNPTESIAILVRGRAHLLDLVPALMAAGIAYKAVDIDPLMSRMAIVDLLSLTRALLDPSDRIAWLSILRAPWCGLSMEDLHALVNHDLGDLNPTPRDNGFADISGQIAHFEAIPNLTAAGAWALARLREQLTRSIDQRRRKPLRQWVEGTWLALGGPTTTPTDAERQDVQTFFGLLEKHDQAGTITNWREFEEALSKLYAQPSSDGDNPVELMTIHKSKGLEFDHVFLPGLDRRTRSDDSPLILWHQRLSAEGDKELVLSPITAAEEEQTAPLYQFLRREKKIKNCLEETRLLYVACTRARSQLWLTANLKVNDKGEIKTPGDNCLLARIWPQIESRMHIIDAGTLAAEASANQRGVPEDAIRRLKQDWQIPSPEFSVPLANWRGKEYDNTEPDGDWGASFRNRQSRHRGTLWHRILRRLLLDGLDHWNSEYMAQQRGFWLTQASQMGVNRAAAVDFIERLQPAVTALRDNAQARWILDNRHQDSQCELPLVSRDGKQQLIVDRTFIHEGTRWIIDFKTSEPDPGQNLEAFLAEERKAYLPQLQTYSHAFARMEKLPQKLALYFPTLRHLEVI
jgi:ATP-dependent helicase/nuclease subunit A